MAQVPDARLLQGAFDLRLTHRNRGVLYDVDVDFDFERAPAGFACLQFLPTHRVLLWSGFYPYERLERARRMVGLGTIAHVTTLLACDDQYHFDPSVVVKHLVASGSLSEQRAQQLNRMGIDPRSPTPFPEYLSRSVDYARSRGFRFD